jgi:ABC-type multidrug transport system fused ATPase/permease subunit
MSPFLELVRLLPRRQRRRLVLLQLVSLLMAFSTLGGIVSILPFFSLLENPGLVHENAALMWLYQHLPVASERNFLVTLGFGFTLTMLAANLVVLLGTLAMHRFASAVGDDLRVALFETYLHREYEFHLRTNSSTLTSNLIHETTRISTGVLQSGLTLITSSVTIVVVVAAMTVAAMPLTLLVAACLGGSYCLVYLSIRRGLHIDGVALKRQAAQRTQTVNESFASIKELLVLRTFEPLVRRFRHSCERISRSNTRILAASQAPKTFLECLTAAGLVAIAILLSSSSSGATSWFTSLTFLGFAIYRLLPTFQQAFAAGARLRADGPAFQELVADLREALAEKKRDGSHEVTASPFARGPHEIRIEDVSFVYEPGRPAALQHCSLLLPAGALVGLTGPNGSGKTTLADLTLGLLVPRSGRIEVDGVALDSSNRPHWKREVAYVPQRIFVADATLAENIAFGIAAPAIDGERLREAARLAQLEELVRSLPCGYDETLGEQGVRLSGGQRQRVGIARALYREASFVVLDEPTSALDEAAERDLIGALASLRHRCTILLIAHRRETLSRCDVVFDLGRAAPRTERNLPIRTLR